MADVTISRYSPGGDFLMQVDAEVVTLDPATGDTDVNFLNDLTPSKPIEVRFYASSADKESGTTITGVCDGITDPIIIPEKSGSTPGQLTCTVSSADPGFLVYGLFDAETSSNPVYETLDPVVIIDGPDAMVMPPAPGVNPLYLAVAAVAGLLVGYMIWGRRKPQ